MRAQRASGSDSKRSHEPGCRRKRGRTRSVIATVVETRGGKTRDGLAFAQGKGVDWRSMLGLLGLLQVAQRALEAGASSTFDSRYACVQMCCLCACVRACVCVRVYVHVYVHTCVCACMCVCVRVV